LTTASSIADKQWLPSKLPTTELDFIPFGNGFDTAMEALNINEDWGSVAAHNYFTSRPEVQSFKRFDEIQQLHKVSQGWYYGDKKPTLEGEAIQTGLLKRNKMIPYFVPTALLRVRTNRGSGRDTIGSFRIYYDKDDVVDIKVITQIDLVKPWLNSTRYIAFFSLERIPTDAYDAGN
jgi:hypothetical protein